MLNFTMIFMIFAACMLSTCTCAKEYKYLGCYTFTGKHDSTNAIGMSDLISMTNENCARFCSMFNYTYAGTQGG